MSWPNTKTSVEGSQGCGSWKPSDSTKEAASEGVSSGAKEAGPTCTENPCSSCRCSYIGSLKHMLFLCFIKVSFSQAVWEILSALRATDGSKIFSEGLHDRCLIDRSNQAAGQSLWSHQQQQV